MEEETSDIDVDFQPETEHEKSLVGEDTSLTEIDTVCESLHLSHASKLIKLSKTKRQSALKTKEEKISSAIKRKLESSFNESFADGEGKMKQVEKNYHVNTANLLNN